MATFPRARDVSTRARMAARDGDDSIACVDAMLRACERGDAKALRRAFQSLQHDFYARRARTMTNDERAAALRAKNDAGVTMLELASMATRLDAHAWLVDRGVGDGDAVAAAAGGTRDAAAAEEFAWKLRDETAREGEEWKFDGFEDVYGAEEGGSGRGGVLGDEAHRAAVMAAARRRARDELGGGIDRASEAKRLREDTESARVKEAQKRHLEALRDEDARWRATLSVDDAKAPRSDDARTPEEYRKRWERLVRASTKGKVHVLRAKDLPFLDESKMSPATVLRDFLIADAPRGGERALLREEMLRWHPDKFAKYLELVVREELQDVTERVNVTSQAVRDAFKAFVGVPA